VAAEPLLRKAAELLPREYQAQWSLYQCLQAQNKGPEAEAQLQRAKKVEARLQRMHELETQRLSTNPHDPAVHYEFGTLLLSEGYDDLGERWLLSALHEDETYEPAHTALADFYAKKGNTEEAEWHRQRAQDLKSAGSTPKPKGGKPPTASTKQAASK
jgi:hypothetical protein